MANKKNEYIRDGSEQPEEVARPTAFAAAVSKTRRQAETPQPEDDAKARHRNRIAVRRDNTNNDHELN